MSFSAIAPDAIADFLGNHRYWHLMHKFVILSVNPEMVSPLD